MPARYVRRGRSSSTNQRRRGIGAMLKGIYRRHQSNLKRAARAARKFTGSKPRTVSRQKKARRSTVSSYRRTGQSGGRTWRSKAYMTKLFNKKAQRIVTMGMPLQIKQWPTAIQISDTYRNGFGLQYFSTPVKADFWTSVNTLRDAWAETPTGVSASGRVLVQDYYSESKYRNPVNARVCIEKWYLKLRFDTDSTSFEDPTEYIADLVSDGIVANSTLARNIDYLPTMSPSWNAKWKVLKVQKKWLGPGQTTKMFVGWRNRNKVTNRFEMVDAPVYHTKWYRVCMLRLRTDVGLDSADNANQMEAYIPAMNLPVQRTATWRTMLQNMEWHQENPVYTATNQDASTNIVINPFSGDTVTMDNNQTAVIA